jgi:hypothetical protein
MHIRELSFCLVRAVGLAGVIAYGLLASQPASADEPFFPDLVFDENKVHNDCIADWYSKHLKVMREPSLWRLSERDRSATVYRFVWLPTFHRPASVRLVQSGEGATLHAVLLSGRGGYEPGKIIVSRSAKIVGRPWEDFKRLLDKVKVWKMPTKDSGADGCDGAQLIFEAVKGGKYHIVDLWTPDGDDDYTKLCRQMLAISGLDVMKDWNEYWE